MLFLLLSQQFLGKLKDTRYRLSLPFLYKPHETIVNIGCLILQKFQSLTEVDELVIESEPTRIAITMLLLPVEIIALY